MILFVHFRKYFITAFERMSFYISILFIFSLFLEMRIALSTGSGLDGTSTARATIHQEITTLKRKRKEGSVLYIFNLYNYALSFSDTSSDIPCPTWLQPSETIFVSHLSQKNAISFNFRLASC